MDFPVNSGMEDVTQEGEISDYWDSDQYTPSCIYCSNLPWLCYCIDPRERSPPPPYDVEHEAVRQAFDNLPGGLQKMLEKEEMVSKVEARLAAAKQLKKKRKRPRVPILEALAMKQREEAALKLMKMRGALLNPISISSDEEEGTPSTEEYKWNQPPARKRQKMIPDLRGSAARLVKFRKEFVNESHNCESEGH